MQVLRQDGVGGVAGNDRQVAQRFLLFLASGNVVEEDGDSSLLGLADPKGEDIVIAIEQRHWVFVGKVLEFSDAWLKVDGRGIVSVKGQVKPADVDPEPRVLVIPRENIAHIRLLPDSFDIQKIEFAARGTRAFIKVPGGTDTSIE